MADPYDLENRFTHHPPAELDDDRDLSLAAPRPQIPRYKKIRETAKLFAFDLNDMCPESREKSLAFTHLEEAVFWANAAIARRE